MCKLEQNEGNIIRNDSLTNKVTAYKDTIFHCLLIPPFFFFLSSATLFSFGRREGEEEAATEFKREK
jgi:hypothetical protein